jgi:hypothetical protein
VESDEADVEFSGGESLKALALSTGCDSALYALEMMVERGISDLCRSLDRASLGDQIAASAGEAVPALQAQGREELANGRDIQYAQPTEPAYVGVMLLEHVWNAMLH